jgi:hypothetical protein
VLPSSAAKPLSEYTKIVAESKNGDRASAGENLRPNGSSGTCITIISAGLPRSSEHLRLDHPAGGYPRQCLGRDFNSHTARQVRRSFASCTVLEKVTVSGYGIGIPSRFGLFVGRDAAGGLALVESKVGNVRNESPFFSLKGD